VSGFGYGEEMEIFEDKLSLRAAVNVWRKKGQIHFVPTMGALHAGHGSLMREARARMGVGDKLVVSLFVNPLQFGVNEDFSKYPRTRDEDVTLCEAEGVDGIFYPSVEEMYPADRSVVIHEGVVSKDFCGAVRAGHFDGVCTVVAKLFLVVKCDVAYFGEKDYQQLAVIKRMVRDLDFDIKIIGVKTCREDDGLAMSSRNRYLSIEERKQAVGISRGLVRMGEAVQSGVRRVGEIRNVGLEVVKRESPLGRIQYWELADAEDLKIYGVEEEVKGRVVVLVAVWFGQTRLIDNRVIVVNEKE
jgi:pantoate--beta-alanine ligase